MINLDPGRWLSWLRGARQASCEAPQESRHFYNARQAVMRPKAFFTSDLYLRQGTKADWQNTDPEIQVFAARYIEAARGAGIPLYAHNAFRTHDHQLDLVKRGVSRAKPPNAPHVQGKAVDIVHSIYHWQNDFTDDDWSLLGRIGKDVATRAGIDIVWGGDWKFYDPAHWELSDWRDNIAHILPVGPPLHYMPRGLLRKHQGR